MIRYALVIGLETYAEDIPAVVYAERDATQFHACLLDLGFDPRDATCLLSAQSTKTKIESELRRITSVANKADQIVLFYAGRGMAIDGSNHITSHDTVLSDLQNTSMSLQSIIQQLHESACDHITLFLDACRSGISVSEAMQDVVGPINESEIDTYFSDAEHKVGFASCRSDQSSYGSPRLRHGIWTHHVLEAIGGHATGALESGRYITNVSLQNHLATHVPATLKMEHPNAVTQTPRCFGNLSTVCQLFDLHVVLSDREAEREVQAGDLKSIDFLGSTTGPIRNLRGFIKQKHTMPDCVDTHTKSFVEKISEQDLEDEAIRYHDQIKSNFAYKRKEITLDVASPTAHISTKDFDFTIHYAQDTADPSSYTTQYQITNIKDSTALSDDGLAAILNNNFNEVKFSLSGSIDIERLIDLVEEQDRPDIALEYPADCSHLTITATGIEGAIRITPDGISVVSGDLQSPLRMLDLYASSQHLISTDPLFAAFSTG
jgi:hypothetical protein